MEGASGRLESLTFYPTGLIQQPLVEQLLCERVWEMTPHPGLFPVLTSGKAAYFKTTDLGLQ